MSPVWALFDVMHARIKWVTTLGQLQGVFNWQLRESVCARVIGETDVRDKCLPVLLVTPSLFTAFTSLLPHPPIFLPPFPSCNTPPYLFSIFAGGIWFHDGQLGLRGSHHDWRIVHLQPQGGGPHLPGLPRWHRVCFNGAALPLTFLKICGLRVGDKGEIQPRWKG